ncbi:MAG TPA: enolase C-terminal domain-like protein [Vicinamibacterales bacterium]|jgi:L-alanine-DL-glutamate epimerase-like enolase superfamily enzyme
MLSRRAFLSRACAAPLVPLAAACGRSAPAAIASRPTDIRIVEVDHQYEEFKYRAPYQFGGRSVDSVKILNVNCRVRTGAGRESWGFGSMTLGNAWAFPAVPHEAGLGAMTALASVLRNLTASCDESGHPLDLFRLLEPAYLRAADDLSHTIALKTPIPKLCTLVVASAFDAAIHDAYGKAFKVSSYDTYGPSYVRNDLSVDLGDAFKGEYLDRYVPSAPRPTMPVFHSVGASDPLEASDVRSRINDGLPNTLEEWIPRDGLIRFKIKLNGGNLEADIDRIVRIDRIVTRTNQTRGVTDWKYLLDFNEGCPNVQYLIECLRRVREATPSGFDRILYIEQPTARDLRKDRSNVMHEAAKLRPVVIDESLTDLETLLLAREMGYTGVALKACKGQSQAMLMAAAAQKFGMFLCVQDLTCPGASLIHSAGIAARVPGNAGIEANARQFVPAANAAWERRFPGLFTINDGVMQTGQLTGPGLGAVPPRT